MIDSQLFGALRAVGHGEFTGTKTTRQTRGRYSTHRRGSPPRISKVIDACKPRKPGKGAALAILGEYFASDDAYEANPGTGRCCSGNRASSGPPCRPCRLPAGRVVRKAGSPIRSEFGSLVNRAAKIKNSLFFRELPLGSGTLANCPPRAIDNLCRGSHPRGQICRDYGDQHMQGGNP